MLVTIVKSVSVWFLLNLSLTLLAKSSKLVVKNLIARCVTHGLNHCFNTNSLVLQISNQNKVFSFAYLEKKT
jgi:hypothetical protein